MDENIKKELVRRALEAKEKAYTPYSHFNVGAAILTEDDKIYTGCNIENASYTPTVCAERVSIFKAVSDGITSFKAIAVVGDSELTYPCGVCRQVIREFSEDLPILIGRDDGSYMEYKLKDFLPYSFGPQDLGK